MLRNWVRREFVAVCFLLASASLLPATVAQEDDDSTSAGESEQEVIAFYQDGVDNEGDDIAVSAVFHRERLYIAATTTASLEAENVGGMDFIVKNFDSDLEPDANVQYGGDGDDYVYAIAGNDETLDIVVVGSTESEEDHLFGLSLTGSRDWFIALLDRSDLSLIGAYVNGTTYENEAATAVAVTADGDFIVAGWTWGSYFGTHVGGNDAWVLKISSDLDSNDEEYEWNIQFGTEAYDVPSSIVIDDSTGYVYVSGTTTDSEDVVEDADETQVMFVYCLDGDTGEIIWNKTTALGVQSDGSDSEAHGLVISDDGAELYLAGNTRGVIPGFEGEETTEMELFLVGIDIEDGATNWVYQSESNATAYGTAGVVLAEDGSPIIGGYAYGNLFNLSSSYWQNGNGDMIAAKIDPDTQELLQYFVVAAASNLTEERAFAMVKVEDVDDGVYLIGQENGEFDDEDSVGDDDDLNYLVVTVELEELPEEDEDSTDDDDSDRIAYWPIGLSVYAVGGVIGCGLYKWAEFSAERKSRLATMV